MKAIDIPTLRATAIVAVQLEEAVLGGSAVFVVTVRPGPDVQATRRWYSEPAPALAFAAEQADRHGLLLLDLREPGDEP